MRGLNIVGKHYFGLEQLPPVRLSGINIRTQLKLLILSKRNSHRQRFAARHIWTTFLVST